MIEMVELTTGRIAELTIVIDALPFNDEAHVPKGCTLRLSFIHLTIIKE